MEEVTLSEWLVEDGAHVDAGTAIYVAATDKIDNEIEATASGTLKWIGTEGETYPVGAVIGEIY